MEDWLYQNWIEIAGTIFAFIYLGLSIRENIWLWPIGFIASFFYLIVFFKSRLYADMGLQVYYLFVSVYGWLHWISAKGDTTNILPTTSLNAKQWVGPIVSIVAINIFLYFLLIHLPSFLDLPASDMPALDAFTTSGGIIATWMLARKVLENWLVWIVVDAVSMGMYIHKGLYVTSFLFFIYTIMALVGYYQWKKHMHKVRLESFLFESASVMQEESLKKTS